MNDAKGTISGMLEEIKPNQTYLDFLADVKTLKSCPFDGVCRRGKLYTWNGLIDVANEYEPGEVDCPLCSETCYYTKRKNKEDWHRFINCISHKEYIDTPPEGKQDTESTLWLTEKGYLKRSFTMLLGSPGVGKSFAVASYLYDLFRGKPYKRFLHWYQARDLFSKYVTEKNEINLNGVIVIDDLGTEPERAEYGSGTNSAVFDSIIDDILREGSTCYITTNLSGDAIRKRYGARALSRIRSSKRVLSIGDTAKDLRNET